MNILTLAQISKNDISLAGGKGASLGEMVKAGFPVPPGFVVTTKAFKNETVLEDALKEFDKLEASRVAVRSSAVAEDSTGASFAGQLETYLNVGRGDLTHRIKDCWNSIESERVKQYVAEMKFSKDQFKVAVVVQKMIDATAAGVMFTANPVTNDRNEMMIEAVYGLGELLVGGMVTPANFIVDKKFKEIISKEIQRQETMLVFEDFKHQEIMVVDELRQSVVLTDQQVLELADWGIKVEKHYGKPQDIEWGIDKNGKIWILQSRPITTLD